jgi:hypothetical protein
VRLEHPGLVRQGLAQDAEHGLELVPVHRVAHQQQPLAAQPLQEVRRVEPTDLARESATFFGGRDANVSVGGLVPGENQQAFVVDLDLGCKRTCRMGWHLGRLQWRGAQRHRVYLESGRPFAAHAYASST